MHQDAPLLAQLLGQLAAQRDASVEILVVASADDAAIRASCNQHHARLLIADGGRGQRLRAGAAAARGAGLWFLHADAGLAADALSAVREAFARGAVAGYFRFRFGGVRGFTQRLLERCIAWRCRVGSVYGDQGIFARREAYFAAGGFAATPLFEEVPLWRGLRRQGPLAALTTPITVNPRRWQAEGYWRRTLLNRGLAMAYMLGVSPERLARWYRGATPSIGTRGN